MHSDYDTFEYIQLIRKADMKEVYTSPAYLTCEQGSYDFDKIRSRLNYYFERVNGGISQQLESPRVTDDQKKLLKLLDKSDYLVRSVFYTPPGIHRQYVEWTKEMSEF